MSSTVQVVFTVALLVSLFETSNSECRDSYVTVCDNIADISEKNDAPSWTELVVGSESDSANPLQELDLSTFMNYKRLTSLTVIGQINRIQRVPGQCRYKRNLQTINFYNNNIKTLETHSILSRNLQKASFINNNIEVLEIAPFDGQVETLDLSNNKIEAIEESRFVFNLNPVSGEIPFVTKSLFIRNNRISYIQPKSLPSCLKVLNLDSNKLRSIDKDALDNLLELEEITLSRNHLYTIPDISNSTKLELIDLSHNKIASINSNIFRNLFKVYFLDLSYNRIITASLSDFSSMFSSKTTMYVSVGFNRLINFYFDNATQASDLNNIELFLYGNPFDCKYLDEIQNQMDSLKIRRNICELKYQSEGKTPVCLNYTNIYPPDVAKTMQIFETSIEKNKNLVSCSLLPENVGRTMGVTCVPIPSRFSP